MHFSSTKYYALSLCCMFGSFGISAKNATLSSAQQKILQHRNLYLIENKGQITDENYKPRTDIQYKLSSPGMNVFIGNGQLHYQFNKNAKNAPSVDEYRMDMQLLGANIHAQPLATEEQAYYERYKYPQFGPDGIVSHAYQKVTYKDIYPNIDWVIYIKGNTFEYDFVVRPGGNVKDIRLAYSGAASLKQNEAGGIQATTPMGVITQHAPYSYDASTGEQIASKFVLKNNILAFNVNNYNGTLVIDPEFIWSTYYGGSNTDVGRAVAMESDNIYMTGYTNSTNNIATTGTYQTTLAGSYDAFLAKYNNSGVQLWATYYGGAGNDQGMSVSTDVSGGVYMCGYTSSSSGISSGAAYQPNRGGQNDAFLVKMDTAGAVKWATYLGGTMNDEALSVTCDAFGYIDVTGYTLSTSGIATPVAYQTTMGGGTIYGDVFIAQFNNLGGLQWSTYYGGTASEEGTGIVTDNSGNIYVTGTTGSSNAIATAGAYQPTYGGSTSGSVPGDCFIIKLDPNGNPLWGTYFGGPSVDNGNSITIDNNYIYVAGNTNSITNIATPHASQTTYGGGTNDGFITKFDENGTIQWATYCGGNSSDIAYAITSDNLGALYITGATSSSNIATSGAYQSTLGGGTDAFLASYSEDGQRLYNSYLGGTGNENGYGMCNSGTTSLDPLVVMTGSASSTSNIATSGAQQQTYGGGFSDGFLTRLNSSATVSISQPFTDTGLCVNGTFNVPIHVYRPFNFGNVFTIQLSDANGSFATPVNIGSTAYTISTSVTCTIPANTPAGNGYRIRIVATDPVYTSPDDGVNIHIISGISTPIATSNSPVCVGDCINLFASDTSSVSSFSYSWTGPNGFTSTSQNPTICSSTSSNDGLYTVTVYSTGCPGASASTNVTVNYNIPQAPTASSNSPLCSNGSGPLTLFASSSDSGATYSWTGPNGFTSSSQNPVITNVSAAASGYYYVLDTVSGCRSAHDSILVTVTAEATPSITISSLQGDTICAGHELDFTSAITDGGNNPQYQWYINQQSMIGAIHSYYGSPNFNNGDTVYCIFTSSSSCVTTPVDTSNKIVVTIEPVSSPAVVINVSPGTTIAPGQAATFSAVIANGGTNPSYQWQVNGINMPSDTFATFVTHALVDGDVVTLIVNSGSNCAHPDSAISNSIVMHVSSDVAQISAFGDVALYPNPNKGTFAIKGTLNNLNSPIASIEILNVLGQTVYTGNTAIQHNEINDNIYLNKNITDGIYMLRISADGQSKVFRFIVQR